MFSTLEERTYDLNKEKTSSRYMGFKVPKILLEAFRDKTLDIISVVGIYRTQILELDNFSEMAASSAFEKEIIHSRKQKTYNLQLFTKN